MVGTCSKRHFSLLPKVLRTLLPPIPWSTTPKCSLVRGRSCAWLLTPTLTPNHRTKPELQCAPFLLPRLCSILPLLGSYHLLTKHCSNPNCPFIVSLDSWSLLVPLGFALASTLIRPVSLLVLATIGLCYLLLVPPTMLIVLVVLTIY